MNVTLEFTDGQMEVMWYTRDKNPDYNGMPIEDYLEFVLSHVIERWAKQMSDDNIASYMERKEKFDRLSKEKQSEVDRILNETVETTMLPDEPA